jgi:hypothetical protein
VARDSCPKAPTCAGTPPGLASGQVLGTPTLFIDGVVHRGGYDPPAPADGYQKPRRSCQDPVLPG